MLEGKQPPIGHRKQDHTEFIFPEAGEFPDDLAEYKASVKYLKEASLSVLTHTFVGVTRVT